MRDLNRLFVALAAMALHCITVMTGVGPLARAHRVLAASPQQSPPSPIVPTPLKVGLSLARARTLLQQKRYNEVLELTRGLLDGDPSLEARFLHGIACARLLRWECADDALAGIAASPEAVRYPTLALELGAVKAAEGEVEEARAWLERAGQVPETAAVAAGWLEQLEREAKTALDAGSGRLHGAVSLGAGWDSDPRSTLRYLEADSGGEAASSSDEPAFDGLLANARGSLLWRRTGGKLEASAGGRLAYQRYLDARWADYELLTGGVAVQAIWDGRLEAGAGARSLWYVPGQPRRFQDALELSVRYGAVAGAGLWAGYRAGYSRYGDLWEIRSLETDQPGSGRPCEEPEAYGTPDYIAYCTAGRTGVRQEVAVGLERIQGNRRWSGVLTLGAAWPEEPVWQQVWTYLDLTGRYPLPWKTAVSWAIRLGWDRFSGNQDPWHSLQLSPTVTLALPRFGGVGVQLRYAPQLVCNVSGQGQAEAGETSQNEERGVMVQYLVRQVIVGEVTYAF